MVNYCSQCDKELKNKEYCNLCGVYNMGRKATFGSLLSDSFNQLFSIERGIFQTIITLLKNPRSVVRSYYEGYRIRYASPARILLFVLITLGFIYYFRNVSGSINVQTEGVEDQLDAITSLKITLLLLTPYLFLASLLTFMRKTSSGMLHLISILYLFLPRLLIFVLATFLLDLFMVESGVYALLFLATFLSTFSANTKVFKEQPRFHQIILFGGIQLLVFIALIVATVFLLSLAFPEAEFSFFN